jgi:hypothetical protein
MRVEVMPGRKTIFLLKGQGKMRRVGISDLRGYYLHRHFIIQQFAGMFQLILLIISE